MLQATTSYKTVETTWLFIAYSDERWLYYQFSLITCTFFSLSWLENVLFEPGSERVNRLWPPLQPIVGCLTWFCLRYSAMRSDQEELQEAKEWMNCRSWDTNTRRKLRLVHRTRNSLIDLTPTRKCSSRSTLCSTTLNDVGTRSKPRAWSPMSVSTPRKYAILSERLLHKMTISRKFW